MANRALPALLCLVTVLLLLEVAYAPGRGGGNSGNNNNSPSPPPPVETVPDTPPSCSGCCGCGSGEYTGFNAVSDDYYNHLLSLFPEGSSPADSLCVVLCVPQAGRSMCVEWFEFNS